MAGLAYAPEARLLVPALDPATAWTVILDPDAVADARAELSINTGAIAISQDGIDWGQAAIDAYEAELQKWGSTVVDFRVPNRTVTINLLVGADNSGESGFIDAAMQLRQKVALFQREGGWIQRGFDVPMYADVVSAALTFADQYGETGFLESNVILTLECLPDFYGDEIELDLITCAGYCAAVLQLAGEDAMIEGDHPGRCRIVVTDPTGFANAQASMYWGFRSRHYDPASTAALFCEAEALTPVVSTTVVGRAGAYGGNVLESAGLSAGWNDFMLLSLSGSVATHRGSYRVLMRSGRNGNTVRLKWGIGDLAHPVINDQVLLDASFPDFQLVDLGVVRLDAPPVGDYAWQGMIQTEGTTTVDFDAVWLQPLDESAGYVYATAGTPPVDDAVLFPSRTMELRTDGIYREDESTGSFNPVAIVTGDLPRIPPSGLENRPVELFIRPSISSPANFLDDDHIDAFTAQVFYRPTYLFRP